ncbi:TPA: hypothetical protein NGS68_000542 [Vibrio parahaemolyticus]|nr:hypothetical protein [Vibrio parahaemolyticus]HCG6655996.1 hypothetical protein [Vibrio parahaemolyticus]HCG6660034.1 hypothetical protein [Vibrio parahaemolyticus]
MSEQAIQRLQQALNRLLAGNPERVKATGRITLNKINNEAGFGRSYIHKFKTFINDVALPAIGEYNKGLDGLSDEDLQTSPASMTPSLENKLRAERNREEKLKNKYRKKNEELEAKVKQLEAINNTLMFRLYELQDERSSTITELKGVNKS